MPIKPENRHRYPKDWKAISQRIRFERAGGRCECWGQCGAPHGWWNSKGEFVRERRCLAHHGEEHPVTGSVVVLTTAHLDHTPENNSDDNLLAMCQRCHLRHDADEHARNRSRTEGRKMAEGQLQLPGTQRDNPREVPEGWNTTDQDDGYRCDCHACMGTPLLPRTTHCVHGSALRPCVRVWPTSMWRGVRPSGP